MVEMSLVMPRFIRAEPGMVNKILRLEQEGERLHAVMNDLRVKKQKSKILWTRAEDITI